MAGEPARARRPVAHGFLSACRQCHPAGETIRLAILRQLQEETPGLKGYWTTHGKPTFAVDGSKFVAPRTAPNQAQFAAATPVTKSRKKKARRQKYKSKADAAKAMTVQVLATVFWHLGSGLPACWKLDPSSGSERQAATDLLSQLPPKSRIVADAEYVGRPFWSAILDSGHSFVIRVGSNIKLLRKLDPTLKFDIEQVYCWPKSAQSQGLPPLVLRLQAEPQLPEKKQPPSCGPPKTEDATQKEIALAKRWL